MKLSGAGLAGLGAAGLGAAGLATGAPRLLRQLSRGGDGGEGDPGNEAKETEKKFSEIKGIAYYDFPNDKPSLYYDGLAREAPKIEAAGFNCVKLVSPWWHFDPSPLSADRRFNDVEFDYLRKSLEALKQQGFKAILGLNYLDTDWAPEGINRDNWITDPVQYAAFESYATEFLRRIINFSDMVFPMVFTEATEPYPKTAYDAVKHAEYLRATLGSWPNRLPPELRKRYSLIYHDYTLVVLGWSKGNKPTPEPFPFDAFSIGAYGFEGLSDQQVRDRLTMELGKARASYPGVPIIVGEFGASTRADRNGSEAIQKRDVEQVLKYLLENKIGFNMWSWTPSLNPDDGQTAIVNRDGSPRPAFEAVTELLKKYARDDP